jgi:predicted O-linked N-acetylglucosamine transferase (SPINDLY family)
MRHVPKSVLWLYEDNYAAALNLKAQALRQNFDPSRLVFVRQMVHAEHLARYRLADLFLDTFPCGAHTTASDALWVGLPVLTRVGESFASRVASSLLHAVGLVELITHTKEEYETLAIDLARDPGKISALKTRLANNRAASPLFNTALFAQQIESAYQAVYERHQNGLAPEHIFVS